MEDEPAASWQNNQPIIAILAQETAHSLESVYPGEYKSFIAASYVKFLEGAGARVVPVWIGKDREYYEDIVNKTNGLLLPGGATWFNQSKGYADAGILLYHLAIEANKRDEVYPILGICLGMELMMYAAAGGYEYRAKCSAQNIALPLEFKPGFRRSRMFGDASNEIIDAFSTKPVTAHFHQFCITEEILKHLNLADQWLVNSLNHDENELEFISTIEAKQYPFFGVQFHPEKCIYEWKAKRGIMHTGEAVLVSQYIANVFVSQTRESHHSYTNRKLEQKELIWNYPITHTGLIQGSNYEQCYLFKGTESSKDAVEDNKKVLDVVNKIIRNND